METNEEKNIPFNNLFLIKGFVTGTNKGWYYLFGIIAAFFGYFLFQTIIALPLMARAKTMGFSIEEIVTNANMLFNPDAMGINRSVMLALMMGMFVFALLFFWIAITFVQKKSLTSIITGYEKIRWKRYFFSFIIWSALLVVLTVISVFTSPDDLQIRFDLNKFIVLLVVVIIFVPIQTATEEILFRGYLMQGFSQSKLHFTWRNRFLNKDLDLLPAMTVKLKKFNQKYLRNGIFPLIITSVLFGLMHGSNPEAKEHGLLIMMPYYILFGAFLGLITLLDEGLELAMGIHCANNLVSSLLVTSKNSVLQTDSIFYTTVENPASEFLSWIVMASVCFFILYKKYKLNNWKLLLK